MDLTYLWQCKQRIMVSWYELLALFVWLVWNTIVECGIESWHCHIFRINICFTSRMKYYVTRNKMCKYSFWIHILHNIRSKRNIANILVDIICGMICRKMKDRNLLNSFATYLMRIWFCNWISPIHFSWCVLFFFLTL